MAGGCTSGHGICGLSRLSLRSLAAVLTFMGTGALTATIASSPAVLPLLTRVGDVIHRQPLSAGNLLPSAAALALSAFLFRDKWFGPVPHGKREDGPALHFAAAACGFLFGIGLGVSGMTDSHKLINFLNPLASDGWDPSVMGVMGAGVGINLLTFRWLGQMQAKPILSASLGTGEEVDSISCALPRGMHPKNTTIDYKLLLGSALFGMGWGLGGICPGPSLATLAAGDATNALLLPGMIVGMSLYELLLA